MPLYEYQCEQCTARFELIQRFSDPPAHTCPSCGGGPVRKLPSSPAIQFKGSGWYITDYARKGGGAAGKAAESTPATNGSGTSGDTTAGKGAGESSAPAASESKPAKKD